MPVDAINPLQLRPVVGPTEDLKYYWSFDNQWTASPIVEDFNNDGLDDFIWLQSNYRTGTNSYDQDGQRWPTYPFLYYESNGDGTFAEKTQQLFPGGQYIGMSASRYLFEDLDGDSINDLLIIDQGYESIVADPLRLPDLMVGDVLVDESGQPWSQEVNHQGAPLVWWKGSLRSPYTPQIIDQGYLAFHHNGSAADIDLDGRKEIFIANPGSFLEVSDAGFEQWFELVPSQELLYGGAIANRIHDSQILKAGFRPLIVLDMNSGGDKFELNFDLLPRDATRQILVNQYGFEEQLSAYTVALDDVNADGLPDLIVGISISYEGGPSENRIYLNENGSFENSVPMSLPFPELAMDLQNKNGAVFIDTADIDGNGLVDVAIGYENPGNGDGAGHFIQLWSQVSQMKFEDITIDAIGSYVTTDLLEEASGSFETRDTWPGGPSWLRFDDINDDGHMDIAMFTQLIGFYQLGGAFLINDGAGNFSPLHYSNFIAPQNRNNIDYIDQASGNYQAVVGDFNGDGLTDSLVLEYEEWRYREDYPNSLREPAYVFALTNLAEDPISRLSNGYDVWNPDQIGFNEFFYAQSQPEAVAAIESGRFPNLYSYFLEEGINKGDLPIAPGSIVRGNLNRSDVMHLNGDYGEYSVHSDSMGSILLENSDGAQPLHLLSVERLLFADKSVAVDLDGSAGQTAKTLAAVIGEEGLSNKEYVGIGLQLFDAGQSLAAVCELALTAVGATTNEDVVNLLYTNLYGEAPTAEVAQPFIDALNNGGFTKGSLAAAAAELTDDLGVIDLVGLAETGIEYI